MEVDKGQSQNIFKMWQKTLKSKKKLFQIQINVFGKSFTNNLSNLKSYNLQFSIKLFDKTEIILKSKNRCQGQKILIFCDFQNIFSGFDDFWIFKLVLDLEKSICRSNDFIEICNSI